MKLIPSSILLSFLFNLEKEYLSRDNSPFVKGTTIEERNDMITFKINNLDIN